MRGRILIIRGGAIGDFILTLPVLAALRRQFPAASLEVLGYPQVVALAAAGGLADVARPIESRPLAGFFARRGALDPALSEEFAGIHVVVSYLFDPDEIFRDNLAKVTKAQIIQGPHRPDGSRPVHATDQLLEPLQRLAIFDADPVPRIRLATAALSKRPCLAVHPGSGSERKNWPEDRWAGLLGHILGTLPVDLLLVGGEAEGERLERLASALPTGRAEILRSAPLTEVAVRLAGCVGFVGHDSGITHLAAAVGLPGLALWGETDATLWRPRSDAFSLVSGDAGLGSLGVATVAAALSDALPDWFARERVLVE